MAARVRFPLPDLPPGPRAQLPARTLAAGAGAAHRARVVGSEEGAARAARRAPPERHRLLDLRRGAARHARAHAAGRRAGRTVEQERAASRRRMEEERPARRGDLGTTVNQVHARAARREARPADDPGEREVRLQHPPCPPASAPWRRRGGRRGGGRSSRGLGRQAYRPCLGRATSRRGGRRAGSPTARVPLSASATERRRGARGATCGQWRVPACCGYAPSVR